MTIFGPGARRPAASRRGRLFAALPVKRLLLIALALLIAGAIVSAFRPKPIPVDVAEVARGPLSVTVDEDGRTRIRERYVVSASLGGQLMRIGLRAGDPVDAGETILAVIEPTNPALLDPRARAEAEARVKAAEARLMQTGPALKRAEAAMQFADSERARAEQLFEKKVISREELEQERLDERMRIQEYRSAQFDEEIARWELEMARAALLRTRPASETGTETEAREWRFRIRAPVGGRILRVLQESATVVTPGTPLLELGDPSDLEVEIDLLSSDAVQVSPGDKVRLERWGGDTPLRATVRLIEPSAFTKISALGVEEQRVNVIVDFVEPVEKRRSLGDGFRVEARVVVWEAADVLKVPTSALFRSGGDWSVFVVENGRAAARPVRVGHRNGLEAEVLDGLGEGEEVILHPSDKVADGVAVRITGSEPRRATMR